jgi:hypothetical protein
MVEHINKDGKLACGCNVSLKDSFYLYRKTYGKGGETIRLSNDRLKFVLQIYVHKGRVSNVIEDLVLWGILEHKDRGIYLSKLRYIQRAALVACTESTSYLGSGWGSRCSKCDHFLGHSEQKKCRIVNWCSLACDKFEILPVIQKDLNKGPDFDDLDVKLLELRERFKSIGCNYDSKIFKYPTIEYTEISVDERINDELLDEMIGYGDSSN